MSNKRCIYCQSISNVLEDEKDCPRCGMENKLTPYVKTAMLNATTFRVHDAYESPSTGKVITNESARKYDMKASGCREWEGLEQEKKYAAKAKQELLESQERQIEQWTAETYQSLPYEKKQVLENAQS